MRKTIHYIDMFAGMGGFREGLTRAGDFVCMGHCEIDKYADRSYRALFDTEGEWFRRGFGDPRGTLFFELARLAEARKPRYLLFENVPGLLSHDGGRTFAAILHTLDRLGYGVEWQVLNSKDFGVPPAAGCILSDILMTDVEEKYFLSPTQQEMLLHKSDEGPRASESIPPKE